MLKKILFFMLIVTLSNCGYSPIFKLNDNINFKIINLNFEGDRTINNYLKSKFAIYENVEEGEEFILNIFTTYIKKIVSKDSTGEASVYELEVNVKINAKNLNNKNLNDFKQFNKDYSFKETFLLESDTDKFEENKYENSIKQNLANTIFDRFIINLINR